MSQTNGGFRILVTGGTGFLGKWVLHHLLEDPRVAEVRVISRQARTHPDPRVRVVACDLAAPGDLLRIDQDFDGVLHLAGQYDLGDELGVNYVNNVLATANLLTLVRQRQAPVPLHFASTYAVAADHWQTTLPESPISALPGKDQSYARTKAMAEQAVLAATLPTTVYRLGVLVGDTREGVLEKIDGPYLFLRMFELLQRHARLSHWHLIPLPVNPDAYLPIVPVDSAARVMAAGLLRSLDGSDQAPAHFPPRIYGVYDRQSMLVSAFVRRAFARLGIRGKPLYASGLPQRAITRLTQLARLPEAIVEYAHGTPRLENPAFERDFAQLKIPAFADYEDAFFAGFQEFIDPIRANSSASSAKTAERARASHLGADAPHASQAEVS